MKKKVLFFTTSGNYFGGGVMCLVETLKHIDRSKIEPSVVMPTHGTTETELNKIGIKTFIVRSYDWLFPDHYLQTKDYKIKRPIRWLINLLAEFQMYCLFRKEKIDAYHLNSVYNDCGVNAANKLNIPVYWHLREFVDDNPWTSRFVNEEHSYSKMSKVHKLLGVSSCIKDFYQKKMPEANIEIVYDGVDVTDKGVERYSLLLNNPIRLTMVGGVTEVKGHEDALRAIKILTEKGIDCHLTIYGRKRDGKYQQHLDSLVDELLVRNYITFAGNTSDMTTVWDRTDIVLIPSKSESFGRVAIEAMHHGIPIVGADNSGTKELITPDIFGLLYKTGIPEDLAKKIQDIINIGHIEERICNSKKRARFFSSENSATSLCNALLD